MSAVTDADRETAADLACSIYGPRAWEALNDAGREWHTDRVLAYAAAVRATEREAALSPMLALADELEDEAQEALEKYPSNGFDVPIVRGIRASANSASFIAERLRAAIAAPGAQSGEGR